MLTTAFLLTPWGLPFFLHIRLSRIHFVPFSYPWRLSYQTLFKNNAHYAASVRLLERALLHAPDRTEFRPGANNMALSLVRRLRAVRRLHSGRQVSIILNAAPSLTKYYLAGQQAGTGRVALPSLAVISPSVSTRGQGISPLITYTARRGRIGDDSRN